MNPRYTLDYEALAERVREYRRIRQLSQQTLAERADLSVSAVAQFESNRKQINLQTFIKLCNALDVDINLLIGREIGTRPIDGAVHSLLDELTEREKVLLYPILTAIIAHRQQ